MFKKYFSKQFFLNCKRLLSLQKQQLDWAKQEQIVMEPFDYVQRIPSKHHRLLSSAFNHWLQISKEKVLIIEDALQTLHTATLLLDDIQDDSAARYGMPSAHRVYGLGFTLNAASNGLIVAGKKITELGHPSAIDMFLNRVEEMHHGQGIDLYWRDHFVCPTEAEHIDMLKKKAASFFILAAELLQLFSSSKRDVTQLAMDIGLFYPLLDDYYNLFYPEGLEKLRSVKQKVGNCTTCNDIRDGKITLAVIHASQFPDVATELAGILKQRTTDPVLQNRAISLLKKHGSDLYTRNVLKTMEAKIRTQILGLGGNTLLTRFMDDLSLQR